jgi:putative ABC transport system permease protein
VAWSVMGLVSRTRASVARHPARTLALVVVIALTLGVFLVLSQVNGSIAESANQAVSSVQNILTVQLAGGSYGGGYFHLSIGAGVTQSATNQIAGTSGVAGVQRIVSQPEQISLGGGGGSFCGSSTDPNVQAMDTTSPTFLLAGLGGVSALSITQGRGLLDSDEQSSSALVGEEFASQNNLGPGSPLDVNGNEFTVVGVFAANACSSGGETVILPFPAGAAALGTVNSTIVFAYASPHQNVKALVSSLQSRLGGNYTVASLALSNQNSLQGAVSSILASAEFAEYATLAGGALTIVVVMVLVTTRRTREIGLMKALGYGNRSILTQISLESLLVSAIGLPMAVALTVVAGPQIAQWAVGGAGSGYVGQQLLANAQFTVTLDVLITAAVVTTVFAVLGAIYPSIRAARLRPTDALKNE